MDESSKADALVEQFGGSKLSPEVIGELLSIQRLHSIDHEDLFCKWESYCMKMGPDDTRLDLETVRNLKKDLQEQLERENRTKSRLHNANTSKPIHRTPRVVKGSADTMGLFDELVPATPRGANGSVKRKFGGIPFGTPSNKAGRFLDTNSPGAAIGSSPVNPFKTGGGPPISSTPFGKRTNAGDTIEVLNEHIPKPTLPLPESSPDADPVAWDNRVKLAVPQDIKRFSYRPMHQKLSEASEVHDDRIDEFMGVIQNYHGLADEQFGNPSAASPSEIVAVGRIVSDALDGKFSPSIVLESSRKMGAGSRIRLKLDAVESYSFFPGQIVVVRGVNASGEYFAVMEILEIPRMPDPVSPAKTLLDHASRLSAGGLNVFVASGPYTTDDNLLFESLNEICDKAVELCPDVLILTGPFIDSQHPLIQSGNFELESGGHDGTLEDLFREKITPKLRRVERSLVVIVPSVRDVVNKHVSFPQEALKRKHFDLPANVKCFPNPAVFSVNEAVFAVSTNDVLFHMKPQEVSRNPPDINPISRLSRQLLIQRTIYPLFPGPSTDQLPKGSAPPNLDVPHMRLADFVNAMPDVLVLPSMLGACTKVVDGVVVVNPGFLSKRMGPGSYAAMHVLPPRVEEGAEAGAEVLHRVYERVRVDVLRI